MPYVDKFQHDVFISYAVVDNDGPYRDRRGWVQAFEEQLRAELQREVDQKRTVDVWLDRKRLSCGDPFDEEIREALKSSAVLVVLLSRQYLASEYCRLERETFLAAIAKQANSRKRVFVVELTDPDRLAVPVPDELSGIHRVPLWELSGNVPRRCGHPVPDQAKAEHQSFYDGTLKAAYAIAERLNRLAESLDTLAPPAGPEPATATPATPPADSPVKRQTAASPGVTVLEPNAPTIYLAEPPRGTDEDRFAKGLRERLENAIPPVRVLPDQSIPREPSAAESWIRDHMSASRLVVHLVGYNAGSPPAGFEMPLSALQRRIAEDLPRPLLTWRLPDVEPSEIDDADQRGLAEQSRAGDIEACRRAIQDRLEEIGRSELRDTSGADASTGGNTLFVNHLPDDEQLARDVCRHLATHHYVCVKRSFDGATEEELRRDFERNLHDCDSLLMIYGRVSKPAARAQLLECVKLAARREAAEARMGTWFVVVAPPPKESASLDLYFDGLLEVDCSRELEQPLIEALRSQRTGDAE